MPIAKLERTVLRLSGDKVKEWLSGLITNSIVDEVTFAALLTPQGKIIADFFITQSHDDLLIDTPPKFGEILKKRLSMYKLRAPVTLSDVSEDMHVYGIWGTDEEEDGHQDPRHASLGRRLITSQVLEGIGDNIGDDHMAAYNAHRLSLGVPDSHWDFESGQLFPLDASMDLLRGLDYQKGCFIGQEVVSRMHRMSQVKKRLRAIILPSPSDHERPPIKAGDDILCGERVVGHIHHRHHNMAIGLVRLDRLATCETTPTINAAHIEIMKAVDGSDK